MDPQLQRLIDIEDIRRTIYRYFYCTEDGDIDGVLSTFTEDAVQEWNGGVTVIEGHEPMAQWLKNYLPLRKAHVHIASNIDVDLNGDKPRVETRVLAFMVGDQLMEAAGDHPEEALGDGHPPMIRVRGTGLTDDFVRTPDGWKVQHRFHHAFWQFETASSDTAAEAKAAERLFDGMVK